MSNTIIYDGSDIQATYANMTISNETEGYLALKNQTAPPITPVATTEIYGQTVGKRRVNCTQSSSANPPPSGQPHHPPY